MKVYGYTRVSTHQQSGNTSIDDQRDVITRTAVQQYQAPPDRIFSDPAVSGSVSLHKRPDGSVLLELLQPGDVVIVAKMDRMFRNATDALIVADELNERGVGLIIVQLAPEPVQDNHLAKFYFTILAAVAEMERGAINTRVREGLAAKRAQGGYAGGRPPFGFRSKGKGREAKLVANPAEQEAIEVIRELSEQGLGCRAISEAVNSRFGLETNHMTVHRVLKRGVVA